MGRKSQHEDATLEQLEGTRWGEPTYPSYLVTECHRLRRVPLRELTIENLRILIGQNIGLQFLMPLAVAKLNDDPLAEGMHHPGDLLCAVLRVDPKFWVGNKAMRTEVEAAAQKAMQAIDPEKQTVIRALKEGMARFSSAGP